MAAARLLCDIGRIGVTRLILGRMLARPDGECVLREAVGEALSRPGHDGAALDFAEMCITALAQLAPADLEDLQAALSDRRPMDAQRFKQRIAAIAPQGRPGWEGPICYVLNTALPQDGSGYSTRSHGLARGLLSLGMDLHCVTRPGSPAVPATDPPALADIYDGISYHHMAGGSWCGRWDYGYFRRAEAVCLEYFRHLRPRAVMAASNHVTAIPAFLAARRLGLPFVYDVRGFWELSLAAVEPGYEGSAAQHAAAALETALSIEVDHLFTLNGAMRGELIRRGTRPEAVTLVPNAVDPARFMPVPRDMALAARLGIAADVPVIGYVGSLNSYEGLDDLVRACVVLHERGRDFRLLVLGDEPGHLQGRVLPELRAIATAAGLNEKVILPGRVPAQEVAAWYSLLDIAPIPRHATAVTRLVSPLKPFEAMAMEKAVVLSDLPPLSEIIRHGETGLLFAAGDVTALADRLEALVLEPELRRRLGRAARQHVMQERDWTDIARICRDRLATV